MIEIWVVEFDHGGIVEVPTTLGEGAARRRAMLVALGAGWPEEGEVVDAWVEDPGDQYERDLEAKGC